MEEADVAVAPPGSAAWRPSAPRPCGSNQAYGVDGSTPSSRSRGTGTVVGLRRTESTGSAGSGQASAADAPAHRRGRAPPAALGGQPLPAGSAASAAPRPPASSLQRMARWASKVSRPSPSVAEPGPSRRRRPSPIATLCGRRRHPPRPDPGGPAGIVASRAAAWSVAVSDLGALRGRRAEPSREGRGEGIVRRPPGPRPAGMGRGPSRPSRKRPKTASAAFAWSVACVPSDADGSMAPSRTAAETRPGVLAQVLRREACPVRRHVPRQPLLAERLADEVDVTRRGRRRHVRETVPEGVRAGSRRVRPSAQAGDHDAFAVLPRDPGPSERATPSRDPVRPTYVWPLAGYGPPRGFGVPDSWTPADCRRPVRTPDAAWRISPPA